MATRRVSDSQPPARGAPPPAAPAPDVKTAKSAPATAEKKSVKRTKAKVVVATPAVNAAVEAALETAIAATPAPPAAKPRKSRAKSAKAQGVIGAMPTPEVSEDERRGMIALSAYLRAERRGFAHGGEADDWAAAEKEVDALLSKTTTAAQ